jgi:RimJ/RimL family protein N-acetyltransferase
MDGCGRSLTTSKGVVAIRPAVLGDAAALRELRLEALAGHPQAFAADYATTAAGTVEVWVERIAEYAADNSGVISTASIEGRLIGMSGLVRGHWPKTRHCGTMWGAYVTPDWRGLHVGEALVDGCVAWARAQGLTMVKLGVVTTNAPAIRCYARCGFTVYGIDPQAIYYDGVCYDELLMAKSL